MRICFIADVNDIHTRRWVEYFCNNPEYEVYVLSTTPCSEAIGGAQLFSIYGKDRTQGSVLAKLSTCFPANFLMRKLFESDIPESDAVYFIRLCYQILRCKAKAKDMIKELKPDLVHCLRLPSEGYIGGLVGYRPLAVSTWGHDLVFNARKYFIFRWLTRKTLSKTDLYFPDNIRDKYIAEAYGLPASKPAYVIPAIGGLRLEDFPLYHKDYSLRNSLGVGSDTNLIISVRGFKYFYIHTESLIRAIPKIVEIFPNTLFVIDGHTQFGGYALGGYVRLKGLAEHLKIEKYIRFTNRLKRKELLDYMAVSDIMVSVTRYDGCPISMLEGMAYGAIPIMSNHSSIQEWIRDGYNGYLIDPKDPQNIARVIVDALKNKGNFETIRKRNWDILKERADYHKNMRQVEAIYHRLVSSYQELPMK